jgi:hypothetical protein
MLVGVSGRISVCACHGLQYDGLPAALLPMTTRVKCLHTGAAADAVRPHSQARR